MIVFWIFFGWFLFVIFGGIGLIALPLDWIIDYFYRPRPRAPAEIAERKILLRRKVEELMSFLNIVNLTRENLEEKKGFLSGWSAKRDYNKKEKDLKK